MIYTFNNKELRFEKIGKIPKVLTIVGFIVLLVLLSSFLSSNSVNEVTITEETKTIVLKQENEFSEEKLDLYISELNLKFPHIVKAQALIESGHFKSNIFLVNNNLFGMKVAKLRPTTAKGENLNHAYYDNWRQSVLDYAFFQAAYLRNIETEEEYFEYLAANYAEDTTYVNKIKQLIK